MLPGSTLHPAGHLACVQLLLDAGLSPLTRNKAGRSPMVEARLAGSKACTTAMQPW